MCGLLLHASSGDIKHTKFLGALSLMDHRGPDDKSYIWMDRENSKIQYPIDENQNFDSKIKLMIGHTRLSIVDLTNASNQPMLSEDNRYAVSFNGEIYNFLELKEELEEKGVTFKTEGDTEVLLKAFIFWGPDCVKKFNGMWSFIILDSFKHEVFFSRDPFGKKPLYYYLKDEEFIVSSEIKSIFNILDKNSRKINPQFLCSFLIYNHSPTLSKGETFYKDIFTFDPGTTVKVSLNTLKFKIIKNNSIENYIFKLKSTDNLESELQSAVNLRLRTDVPIAVLVSGGVDSSLIASLVKNNKNISKKNITFYTAKSENSRDLKYAKMMAGKLGIKLKIIEIPTTANSIKIIEDMINQYEIPIQLGGLSVSAFYMFKTISEDGIKVIIDGTGGDEIFSGYNKDYRLGYILSLIYSFNLKLALSISSSIDENFKSLNKISFSKLILGSIFQNIPLIKKLFDKFLIKRLTGTHHFDLLPTKNTNKMLSSYFHDQNSRFGNNNFIGLSKTQIKDIKRGKLPNWLFLGDQNSMYHSLELRSPLLDVRFLKYINLQISKKIKIPYWKYSLREILFKYDKDVAFRNEKVGFEWNGEYFLINNKETILNSIKQSKLVSSIFCTKSLISNFDRISDDYTKGKFYLRVYILAVLDKSYNLYIN